MFKILGGQFISFKEEGFTFVGTKKGGGMAMIPLNPKVPTVLSCSGDADWVIAWRNRRDQFPVWDLIYLVSLDFLRLKGH